MKGRIYFMKMVNVVSSNVVSVGYKDNDLYVNYKSGNYVYRGVPKEKYDDLLKAGSKGKYMYAHIKGKYEYKRIG